MPLSQPSISWEHLLRHPTADAVRAYGKLSENTDSLGTDSSISLVREGILNKLLKSNRELRSLSETYTASHPQYEYAEYPDEDPSDSAEEVHRDEIDERLPGQSEEKKALIRAIFKPQSITVVQGFGQKTLQITFDRLLKDKVYEIVREFPDILHNNHDGKFSIVEAIEKIFERLQIQLMKKGFNEIDILPFIEKSLVAVEVFLSKRR